MFLEEPRGTQKTVEAICCLLPRPLTDMWNDVTAAPETESDSRECLEEDHSPSC